MADPIRRKRLPGSRNSSYELKDHLVMTLPGGGNANPHPQYLLKDDYIASEGDNNLAAHKLDPNAHINFYVRLVQISTTNVNDPDKIPASSLFFTTVSNLQTQIDGRALIDHTHTPESIGAADRIHNHDTLYSKLDHNHDDRYSKLDHTHTPVEIGAADRIHNHDDLYIKISDISTTFETSDTKVPSISLVTDLNTRFVNHDHDDRYSLITHIHPYVLISDLEDSGIYPELVVIQNTEGTDDEGQPVVTTEDLNTYQTIGNYFVLNGVLNAPEAGNGWLTVEPVELEEAQTDDDDRYTGPGVAYVMQRFLSESTGTLYYRKGTRVIVETPSEDPEDPDIQTLTYNWAGWESLSGGGGGKVPFEIFHTLSTQTPPGAFPLWTGEWIENCRTKYPSFWNKALELRDADTGAFVYADMTPVAMPFLKGTNNTTTTADGTWTGEASDGTNDWQVFGDLGVGGNVDITKLSTTPFWMSLATSGDPISVVSYEVQATNNSEKDILTTPTAWKLEGTVDGSSWDLIDTQTGITWSAINERKRFTVTPSEAAFHTAAQVTAAEAILALAEYEQTIYDPNQEEGSEPGVRTYNVGSTNSSYNSLDLISIEFQSADGWVVVDDVEITNAGGIYSVDLSTASEGAGAYRWHYTGKTVAQQQLDAWNKTGAQKRPITPTTYKKLKITFTECSTKPNSNSTMGRVNFMMEKVGQPGRQIGNINVMDATTYEYFLEKYGEVGGFVIDEANGKIRLPLINRFLRTIEDINDLGTVQADEFRRHEHSSVVGPLYVRPSVHAPGADGDHWHHNDANPTGSVGGSETRPKNVAVATYIQVSGSVGSGDTTKSASDVTALATQVEQLTNKVDALEYLADLIHISGSSAEPNGYVTLSNGLTIQWGHLTVDADVNSPQHVTFPKEFASETLAAVASSNGNNHAVVQVRNFTTSGMDIAANDPGNGAKVVTDASWIAIGK